MLGGALAVWLVGLVGDVPPRERVLVLDADIHLLPAARELSGPLPSAVAGLLTHYRRIEPLTSDDVRALSSLEAQRQEMGCDSSCAVEIANALGARHVIVLQLLGDPLGVRLTVSLIDAHGGAMLGRTSIAGARGSEILAQLPFALDVVVASLRHPDDPPVGATLANTASLAVLPVRVAGAPFAGQARWKTAIASAAHAAAERMGLALLDEAATARVVAAAGCRVDDQRCGLPLLAMNGARLTLRIAVTRGERVIVRASILRPDGSAATEAERSLPGTVDDDQVIAAIVTVIGEAGAGRLAPATTTTAAPKPASRFNPHIQRVPRASLPPRVDGEVRHVAGDDDPEEVARPVAPRAPPVVRPVQRSFVSKGTCGERRFSGKCVVSAGRLGCAPLATSRGDYVLDVALDDISRATVVKELLRLQLVDGSTCELLVAEKERQQVILWLVPEQD